MNNKYLKNNLITKILELLYSKTYKSKKVILSKYKIKIIIFTIIII